MTPRTLVVDATGRIRRTITAPPSMLAANAREGERLFLIENDDGLSLHDGHLVVSEAGALVPADGAPEGLTPPAYDLQYVAT